MIEKLKTLEDGEIDTSIGAVNTRFQDTPLVQKINELVDVVNDITDWVKCTDETIVKYGIKPIENGKCAKIAQDETLKCPICGTPLEYDIGYDGDYFCAKCGRAKMFGSQELWQELIRTRKALDVALKGLDDIIDSGSDGYWTAIKTEEQIKTALEQKDVK